MLGIDYIRMCLSSVFSNRLRSSLTGLGITVGIAAVVLLTSIGEGINRYVVGEFTQFGSYILSVSPGKSGTFGMSGALVNTTRPLTLADSDAISRLAQVEAVNPYVVGNAPVEYREFSRRTNIYGVGSGMPEVWTLDTSIGNFLPEDNQTNARPFVVLGSTVRDELFGQSNPLGEKVRIDGSSFRVIGVADSKGNMMGIDLDDTVFIPVSWAQSMFDREGLMAIDITYTPTANLEKLSGRVKSMLIQRHGSEDFTIQSQEEMISTLDSILNVLTFAVGGLGGISLLVGAVGILTIMTIAVTERTNEVGLFRALGGGRGQILALFLGEAMVLAALGGLGGLIIGAGGAWVIGALIPALPTHTPWAFVIAAELVATTIGLIAGVAPAWKAANLDPIDALRTE